MIWTRPESQLTMLPKGFTITADKEECKFRMWYTTNGASGGSGPMSYNDCLWWAMTQGTNN